MYVLLNTLGACSEDAVVGLAPLLFIDVVDMNELFVLGSSKFKLTVFV
jgi:hypothetical protein